MTQPHCSSCGQEERYGHNAMCVMNTVDELRAEVERLTREAEQHLCAYQAQFNENGQLRAALQPFAEAAKCAEADEADDYCVAGSSARHRMTLGDLHRARAALEPKP